MTADFTVPAAYFERMQRTRGTLPRPRHLAPLEPNAFLRWAWRAGPMDPRTSPLTVEDVWWELVRREPSITRESVRRDYVRIAARVRRNHRLGMPPFWGV